MEQTTNQKTSQKQNQNNDLNQNQQLEMEKQNQNTKNTIIDQDKIIQNEKSQNEKLLENQDNISNNSQNNSDQININDNNSNSANDQYEESLSSSLEEQKQNNKNFKNLKQIDTQILHLQQYSDVDNDNISSISQCSIRFGGSQYIDEQLDHIYDYDSEEVPKRSILKSYDSKDSRDFRNLKNIDGKAIKRQGSQFKFFSTTISDKSDQDDDNNCQDIKFSNKTEQIDTNILLSNQKVQLNKFPSCSILKNSPLIQPSEFQKLKKIENKVKKVKQKSKTQYFDENIDEIGNIRFAGEILLDKNMYQFEYDPQDTPDRPILKRNSLKSQSQKIYNENENPEVQNIQKQQIVRSSKKKRSYQFTNLKNIEGKVIKTQSEFLEDDKIPSDTNFDYRHASSDQEQILQQIQYQSEDQNDGKLSDVQFKGIDYTKKIHFYQSNKFPQKTILIKRRKSLDLRKLRKIQDKIDGKILRRQSMITEEKSVHFGCTITAENSQNQSFQSDSNSNQNQNDQQQLQQDNNIQKNNDQEEQDDIQEQTCNNQSKNLNNSNNLQQNNSSLNNNNNLKQFQQKQNRRTSQSSNPGKNNHHIQIQNKPILKKNTNVQITSPKESKINKFYLKMDRFRQEYIDNMYDLIESLEIQDLKDSIKEKDEQSQAQFIQDIVYVLKLKLNNIENLNYKNVISMSDSQSRKQKFFNSPNNSINCNQSNKLSGGSNNNLDDIDMKNMKIIQKNIDKQKEITINFIVDYLEGICQIDNFSSIISENTSNDIVDIIQSLKSKNLISDQYFQDIYRYV